MGRREILLCALVCMGLSCSVSASADAAVVSSRDIVPAGRRVAVRTFVFAAFPGERNNVGVGLEDGGTGFFDTNYVISKPQPYDPGGAGGCIDSGGASPGGGDARGAECVGATPVVVLLGDGNDRATITGQQAPGAHVNLPITVNGGDGHDLVLPGVEHHVIEAAGVTMRLFGERGDDALYAAGGDDLLSGGIGNDRLYGAAGNDSLYGGAANDVLLGGLGDDHLYGGSGSDRIYTGLGHDFLDAGPGNDNVSAFNHARNVIRCGTGYDTVRADTYDVLIGCERRL